MAHIRVVELDENTRVPLRVVWVVGGALGGGLVWLTTLFIYVSLARSEVAEAKIQITEIQRDRIQRREEILDYLHKLDKKVTAISTKLKVQMKDEEE